MKKIILLLALSIVSFKITYAQVSLNLSGYPLVTTGWTIGGTNAAVVDSEVMLTTAAGGENGYVYYNTIQNVTGCGQFKVDFDFKIVASGTSSGVADGIAFFFINPLTAFVSGGGLGLPSPLTGLVLTLDPYDNDGDGLNPESELFGYTTPTTYAEGSVGRIAPIYANQAFIDNGAWHHVTITYNGGVIKVYYNGSTTATMTANFPIATSGYFGFSASTGGSWSTQYVKAVHITSNSISPINGNTAICVGSTSALSDSTAGGTWSSSAPLVASISATGVVDGLTPGTSVITYAYGTGCSTTATVTVTALPAAPVAPTPVDYCQGAPSVPLTATGTGLLWYTVATGGVGTATAPTPSTATIGTVDYYVSQTTGSCTSPRATVAVNVSLLTTPVATNNGPVCVGSTVTISSTLAAGDYYKWTGPGSFTATTQNVTLTSATVAESGVYCVRDSTTGCASAQGCTTVSVQAIPVISIVVPANPTACFGSDGSLTLSSFTAGATYTVEYTSYTGGIVVHTITAVANATGNIVISGLAAGLYNYITVISSAGCTSAPSLLSVLTNVPVPVISSTSSTNPSTCLGTNGSITLNGLNASATYVVNYTLSGVVYTVTVTANPSGQVIINGLSSGTYSNITVNSGGACVSAPVGPITLTDPPAPVVSSSAGTNPSTCISNDGTITLNGLTSGIIYTVDYTLAGILHSVPVTANGTGQVILTGLTAGTYSGISVTDPSNCNSASVGPITLSDPFAPVISSTSSTGPATCLGTDGTITLNGLTAGVVYTTYYTLGGVIHSVSATANASGQVIITGLSSGSYSAISVTNPTSCSSASVGPVVLTDPASPVIASTASTGPTTCLGTDGTITLNGLSAGVTYTVNYLKAGTPVVTSIAANAAGQVIITGLGAAAYSNISVTSPVSCGSNTIASIILTDPVTPGAPTAGSNSPLCSGNTLLLTATGEPPALIITYSWSGPGAFASTLQDPSVTGVTAVNAGIYSVTATSTGCTSLPGTVTVVVNPVATISATFSNPSLCGSADGTITLSGGTSGISYTVNYTVGGAPVTATIVANAAGQVVITGLLAGTYSSISISSLGCPSNIVGPLTLTDPLAPAIPVAAAATPVCANGTLSFTGTDATPGVSWSWTGPGFATPNVSENPAITGVTTADAGTYTLAVTLSGCTSSTTVTVIVNPIPLVPVAGSNSPLCSGNTLLLTASGEPTTAIITYGWTGPNTFTSSLQNPSLTGVLAIDAGTYSVTATHNGCTSAPGTVTVVVNPTAAITSAFTNPSLCGNNDGTITLSGGTAGTVYTVNYTFGGAPVTTTITANASGQVVITGLTAGTYTLLSITASGCPSNTIASVTLTDPLAPAVPVAAVSTPVCQGSTLSFTGTDATAGVSWSWTGPGFATPNVTESPTIAGASTADAGTYTLTVSKSGCSSSATVNVVVNPLPPVPVAGSNSPVCSGNTIDLTVTSAAGVIYTWSGPLYTATTTGTLETIPGAIASNAGIYTVTATLNGCAATAYATVAVTINTTPGAPVGTDAAYCEFAPAVPLTAAGTNLLWYTAAAGGTGSAIAPVPSTAATGTTTWYVSQTSALGCESARTPVTVTVSLKPAPPVVTASYGYCQFDVPVTLAATGTALDWYGPGYTAPYTTAPAPSTAVPGNFFYYVTQSVAGCNSDSAMITVMVSPRPLPPVTANLDYCQGVAAQPLTAVGTNLLWYTVATGGISSAIAPVPSTAVPGITDWYVTQSSGGCESFRATVQVTVHAVPVFAIAAGKPYDCQYDTISLSYSGLAYPGAIYSWSVPPYAVINGSASASSLITTFDTSSGSNVVSLTVGDGYVPCNVTENYSVTVYNAPVAEFYVKPSICAGDTTPVALSYSGQGIAAYHWNFDGGIIVVAAADSAGPYKVTYPDSGLYNITLTTVSGQNCPSKIISDTVNVHGYPNAQIAPVVLLHDKSSICIGDSVLFTPLNFTEGYYYAWSPAYYFNVNDTRNVYGIIEQPGYVKLTVNNAYGCAASDSIFVSAEACCMVEFPNAFTPNGDGKNDVFRPITLGNHKVHDFRIANRWGQTVFESAEVKGAWDGKYNGVPADMDVYFYYFSYDCDGKKIDMKGEVNLVR